MSSESKALSSIDVRVESHLIWSLLGLYLLFILGAAHLLNACKSHSQDSGCLDKSDGCSLLQLGAPYACDVWVLAAVAVG